MKPFQANSTTLRRALLSTCAFALAAAASLQAQTPSLVPLPFAGTVIGGNGNTACASGIPNNAGVNLGDGCLPNQVNVNGIYGGFTDAIGNVYFTENGTNTDLRVLYKGGAALTAALIASNANLTNFTPIPGRVYDLVGALGGTLTKIGSKYTCNGQATGQTALDSAGDGCPGAQVYAKPRGMFVDPLGNVFFVSTGGGNTVKVLYVAGTQVANLITTENPGVTPQVGYVYQLAGLSTANYSGNGALAKNAAILQVRDIALDSNGNIYVTDGNSSASSGNNVRVIYVSGTVPGLTNPTVGFIYTFAGAAGCTQPAGSCTASDSGDGGPASAANLNGPYNLAFDRFNNLYIAEYLGQRMRVVYFGGTIAGISNPVVGNIYTYAGGGAISNVNGTAAQQLKFGIADVNGVDASGNVYLEDFTSKVIWRFDANTGIGYIVAGHSSGATPTTGAFCSGTTGPRSVDTFGDGCPSINASVSDTGRISFDPQGNFYVGENSNLVVREFSFNTQFPNTSVGSTVMQPLAFEALAPVTLAIENFSQQGSATSEFTDAGTGTCTATSALTAASVCVFNVDFTPAHDGTRLAAQQLSTASTTLTTSLLSGTGVAADLAVDPATQTAAGSGLTPSGVVTDLHGNVFVSDRTGNQVLFGSLIGTTLSPVVTGLNKPADLALDTLRNLYIADTGNNRVLEVTTNSTTTTIIGTIGSGLSAPQGVAVDAFGNTWIADTGNNRVVEVTPSGVQVAQTAVPLTGLSAPTQLTFDYAGNLFVVDSGNQRVVELPVNGSQTTVTLPSGVIPTAVAVDPSGTVYITDAASRQLIAFAPGDLIGLPLLTGLVTPAALASDPDGNLFLADTGTPSLTILNRSVGNITFPITNVNQSSTAAINVANVGNAALNFPTSTLATVAGSSTFTLASATTNGCATGVSYTPGQGCNFTATFLPTAKGPAAATAAFNTNAANTASAALSATGQQLVSTGTAISITSPTGVITYGQTVVLTATVTPTTNAGAPTGTVVFTVDGRAQTPLPYGTGTYTLSLTSPAVGTHTVSVAFSGDSLYASSNAPTSFTVGQAVTTTTLTLTPINSNGTVSLTFSATVASPTATGETGTVSFYAGSTLVGTATLGTNRIATYPQATLSFATNTFTAVYSGDANFAGSTSTALSPTSDFAIGSSAPTVSIPQGGIAPLSFVIASLYGSAGTITPTCSGLPANSVCRFYPTSVAINGTSVAVSLQIYTNVNSNLASSTDPTGLSHSNELFVATLLPLSFGLLAFRRRSRALRNAALLCFALFLIAFPLTGCGSGSSAATSNVGLVTPAGTSTVTVTFTGTAPLTTHTTTFTFNVLTNNTQF